MKKSFLIFLFFVTSIGYSQSNGISYQAALLNPKVPQQTGQNSSYVPLLDKNVCLRFEIRNAANQLEYQETQGTKTDAFGMVNLIIGKGSQTAGTAANFNSIIWNTTPKKLVVALDTEGNCSSFIEISNQDFTGTPFSFLAQNAENVSGVVAITNGGTGATTAADARKNLGLENLNNTSDTNKPVSIATQTALDLKAPLISPTFTGTVSGINKTMVGLGNVDNTSDLNKPISTATQTALDLKENLTNKSNDINADGNSTTKYPSVKLIKDYIDASVSSGVPDATTSLKGKILLAGDLTGTATAPLIANNAITDAKVANGISASKVGLGNVDNTSDPSKPISTATQSALDLKAPLASPTFTGTVSGIDKAMVGLGNVDNTSDASKPISTLTQTALDLKQNALTNPVTGTGTVNSLPKFTGTSTLGNSNISDNGTLVSITTDATVNGLSLGRGATNLDSNTVLGLNALTTITTGSSNTAVGSQVLRYNTTGVSNTAIGRDALFNNTIGNYNVAVGKSAMVANTAGSSNTMIGHDSGLDNTTGSENVAVGLGSFWKNKTGSYNTAIGRGALNNNTIADSNTAIGWAALNTNISGGDNIAIGYGAGRFDSLGTTAMTTSSYSVYVGANTRGSNAPGSTNEIVIGNSAVGLGDNSTVLGNSATTKAAIYGNLLLGTTTDNGFKINVNGTGRFSGQLSLGSTITNGVNTFTLPSANGTLALVSELHNPLTIGTGNGLSLATQQLSLGIASASVNGALSATDWTTFNSKQNALINPVTGTGTANSIPKFTGASALGNSNISDNGTVVSVTTDATVNGLSLGRGPGNFDNNTVFGKSALSVNTAGINNTAIGFESLFSNTSGESNTAIGINALRLNTLGKANVAIGINALINNTTGNNNTAVGAGALFNSAGSNNAAFGINSSLNLNSGSNNTTVGLSSGRFTGSGASMTSFNNSIYLGAYTRGLNATGSTNEIVIGYDVVGLGSNTTVLGNSATTKTAVYGNLQVNGAYTNASSNNEGTDTTIDFSLSNIAYTSATSNAITLTNIKDGGVYNLVTTATTVSDNVEFRLPDGFTIRYMGTSNRTSGKIHLYRFVVAGANVLVTMSTENN